jgi:hypothetical protein
LIMTVRTTPLYGSHPALERQTQRVAVVRHPA